MATTTDKPRMLVLYAGVGGACKGYRDAGWDTVGVDIAPQPNHFDPSSFVQGDALEYLAKHGAEFDAVHASPPCQGYSWSTPTAVKAQHPMDHIAMVRELADYYSLPHVIENVLEADRKHRQYRRPLAVTHQFANGTEIGLPVQRPIVLCGTQFGLPLLKHRVFEVGEMVSPLPHHPHQGSVKGGQYITVAGHGGDGRKGQCSLAAFQKAMEMPWAKTRHELAEAIPPAYTRYIGEEMLAWL